MLFIRSFALLLVILAFQATQVLAQPIDLGTCEADGLSIAGLATLKNQLQDARIIIIGEQDHGVGTDYESFALLTKFLHEELDFNVLIQEYCFYSFGQINPQLEAGASAQKTRQAMYWPQGLSQEYDALLDYVDQQNKAGDPIAMEGFDARIWNRKAFAQQLDSLLNPKLKLVVGPLDRTSYQAMADTVLKYEYRDTVPALQAAQFIKTTEHIITQLEKKNFPARTIQELKSFNGFVKNAWNIRGVAATSPERFHEREKQMAANIIWLAEEVYPNQKIIIRTHNGHAAKNIQMLEGILPDSLIKGALTLGSILHERYGDTCLHLATTAYRGSYCKWDYKPQEIPKPHPESIESQLHKAGLAYAYQKLSDQPDKHFYMFFNDFNRWHPSGEIKAPWGRLFDGLIYIDSVKAPTKKKP